VSLLLVSEVVEDEEAMIAYLHDRGIMPGTRLKLLSTSDGAGAEAMATLNVAGSEVVVPSRVAHALWVVTA